MLKRFVIIAFMAVAGFAALVGCDNDPEQQRSVVTIASLNCNLPVFSDVLEQGDSLFLLIDDFVAEDWVQVWFYNRPYNGLVITEPVAPHGDFLITDYRIAWTSGSGGPVLATRMEQVSINVSTRDVATGWIRMVSLADKLDPIIVALRAGGVTFMTANITFYGHEIGTDRTTTIEARASVEFTEFFIATKDKEPIDECTISISN